MHSQRRVSARGLLIVAIILVVGGAMLAFLRTINSSSQGGLVTPISSPSTPFTMLITASPTPTSPPSIGLTAHTTPTIEISPVTVGQVAPDFTLTGVDGKPYRLRDYQGKRIILNFWASWCAPCRVEMPLLDATHKRLQKSGIVVLGVNQREDVVTARRYVDELKPSFPTVLDSDLSVSLAYEVFGLPTTFFIDTKGIIRAHHLGMLTEDDLRQYLDLFEKSEP